jgi:cob(I)alamin adenosyltransferase
MAFEDYQSKDSVVVVFTGENKGKTSASLGMMVRALGTGWKVAYIQFVKHWEVGEHQFIRDIKKVYKDNLFFYKGGKGFYNAGEISAKGISTKEHQAAALDTFNEAMKAVASGDFQLVVCDEINNAVHDGLLELKDMEQLLDNRHPLTNLCLTGRNFPKKLLKRVDIATDMTKLKHHFDDKFLANEGIDY